MTVTEVMLANRYHPLEAAKRFIEAREGLKQTRHLGNQARRQNFVLEQETKRSDIHYWSPSSVQLKAAA